MLTSENQFDIPEDILRQCLQEMYPRIIASFEPRGYILDSLFGKGSISINEKQHIEGLSERRGAALVDMLLICKRPNAIAKFLEILSVNEETSCKWISDELCKAARENIASSLAIEMSSVQLRQDVATFQSKQSQTMSQATKEAAMEQLRNVYTKIKTCLDPRYGMLDQLYEKGVLSHETHKYISSFSNPEECCGKLFDHLLEKGDIEKSLAVFKDILRKDHSWVYNMMWMDPKDVVDPNNRPLSEDERRRIIFNNRCLIKLIDPYKHDFLSHLVEKDCITFSHFQKLTSMSKVDKSEMISELFTILLRRSFVHFQLFIQCLKYTLQHNLGQILENNGVVLIMQINLRNNKLEKHIAEVLTGTIELDDVHLDVGEKQLVEDILKSLEEKGLVIVGGAYGSLFVYILHLTMNAVNELEKLYKTKELETCLNNDTQLSVTIKIGGR